MGSRYNPRTGTYSRGAVAYGPYNARAAGQAYNPRTGAYGATRQGANVYGSWGTTAVQRGDQWAATSRTTNNATGVTTRRTQTSEGSAVSRTGPAGHRTTVGASDSGDLYAGRDGNVYKKDQGGSWQSYNNGGWNNVQQPTTQQRERAQEAGAQVRGTTGTGAPTGQLNADSTARAQGTQRTSDASRASSSTARTGSYRPSGGGARSVVVAGVVDWERVRARAHNWAPVGVVAVECPSLIRFDAEGLVTQVEVNRWPCLSRGQDMADGCSVVCGMKGLGDSWPSNCDVEPT